MSSTTRYPSQPPEDWDHLESPTIDSPTTVCSTTPSRVVFPSHGAADDSPVPGAPPHGGRAGKRTLSELLKLHAEKGTDVHFSAEEAARLEEVLGQWINSGPSPYEGEDDDFFTRSKDGTIVLSHRSSTFHSILGRCGRGQSESAVGIALES
ncbi:hypothetical protein H4582DRAFT_1920563 [Lactarius indigo]|nr:hypothetical protein H4582DRAFT_2038149 [Lactarius indigo]KAI9444278.1 hypothetical protein H4582DRAFT_1920563 [Lactarius indigo]